MKPIDEICGRATAKLYDELHARVADRSVIKIRDALATTYADFIPRILPNFLTLSAPEIFDQADMAIHPNSFTLRLPTGVRRDLVFNTNRRAWTAADLSSLADLPRDHQPRAGSLLGTTSASSAIPRAAKSPARTQGMCVIEVSLDWRVDVEGDSYDQYTFAVEGIPDISALCVRVPRQLRFSFPGVGRIARVSIELTRAFTTWLMETLSNLLREQAVQLSSQLYQRPRVLLRDIASTLAFSCLIRGKDFVLFDDASFTGFVDVMERSSKPNSVSALHLSGILLGEIVAKDNSAIAFVLDKPDGEGVEINLKETNAYSNDEALQHAITTAWGDSFLCTKLCSFKEATFVLFCPAEHQTRVKAYVQDNLTQIQNEIKGAYQQIMSYVKLIEDLRLGSLFDAPRLLPTTKKTGLLNILQPLHTIAKDRPVRDEVISAIGGLLRKFLIGV